jgi:cytochrome c peroxidase
LFLAAFPGEAKPITASNVVKAIASFERTIISGGSPWDRYHFGGEDDAVSPAVRRGEVLFFSSPLSCFRCHGGFNFSGPIVYEGRTHAEVEMKNNGLRQLAGEPSEMKAFKAPTLRNIAVTGPYMHDGRLETLEGVLDHYARGGDDVANKDPLVHGFLMSAQNKADLIEFLNSLTDNRMLHDPRFANPW